MYRLRIVSEDKVRMQRRLFWMNDKKRNPNPTVDEFGFLGFGGAYLSAVEHFYIIAGHLFGLVVSIDRAKESNFYL